MGFIDIRRDIDWYKFIHWKKADSCREEGELMKKTAVFVSGVLVLCIVYLLGYVYLNDHFQLPSNLIKGDRKAMGDITLTTSFVNHVPMNLER